MGELCEVNHCRRPVYKIGWCQKHYRQRLREAIQDMHAPEPIVWNNEGRLSDK